MTDSTDHSSDFDVLAAAAHDLKSPLSLIYGISHELADQAMSTEQATKQIVSASEQMINTIDSIMIAQKVAKQQLELELSPVDIASIIDQTAYNLQPFANAQDHDLRVRISRRLPTVMAHKPSVERIVHNMLSTAIRISKPNQKILVDARKQDGLVGLAISDTSHGIKPSEWAKMTTKPGKLLLPSPALGESSGVSLYIVRQLSEAMNGDFSMQKHAKGPVFLLRLPQVAQLRLF